jgi:hypothetical protein
MKLPEFCSYHYRSLETVIARATTLPNGVTGMITEGNIVLDHQRLDVSILKSGIIGATTKPAYVLRHISDGTQLISRQQEVDDGQLSQVLPSFMAGTIHIMPDGYIGGFFELDELPVAQTLLAAGTASITGTEMIGQHRCAILDGSTPMGTYRIWLDEQDGYRLRRATQKKTTGDRIRGGQVLPITARNVIISGYEMTISDMEATRIGNYLVPTSATLDSTAQYTSIAPFIERKTGQRTRFNLNPDLAAMHAFIMDGIPNGVRMFKADRDKDDHLPYMWKDGKVVVDTDEAAVRAINKAVDAERQAATQPAKGQP